ncbi:MAG: spermidine synthase [Planctomycetota bacterium]
MADTENGFYGIGATNWVIEYLTPWDGYAHGITRVLAAKRTDFQDMQIVESGAYGKALVLDGMWQSCTGEEFVYHEPLVQLPSVLHGNPKSVLVLGGGEGATVREALRWKTVEKVKMVDIDGDVVEACREHLPEMHQGAFDDPRTDLLIGDALAYMDAEASNPDGERFDIAISDLVDPIEDGPSQALFTAEYFAKCRAMLKPGGVLIVQAGPVAVNELRRHARLYNTIKIVFRQTMSAFTPTSTYGSPWSYVIASDEELDLPRPEDIDKILDERGVTGLRMFDGITAHGLTSVPKHIRTAVAEHTDPFTMDEKPVFFSAGS